jgi:hypothetical protein
MGWLPELAKYIIFGFNGVQALRLALTVLIKKLFDRYLNN